MSNDSIIDNLIFVGIMALAEEFIRNSFAFSLNSLDAPSFLMENHQLRELMPNTSGRLEMQTVQQQQQQPKRRKPRNLIWCRHCPNKMLASHMPGKVLFFKHKFHDFLSSKWFFFAWWREFSPILQNSDGVTLPTSIYAEIWRKWAILLNSRSWDDLNSFGINVDIFPSSNFFENISESVCFVKICY